MKLSPIGDKKGVSVGVQKCRLMTILALRDIHSHKVLLIESTGTGDAFEHRGCEAFQQHALECYEEITTPRRSVLSRRQLAPMLSKHAIFCLTYHQGIVKYRPLHIDLE